MYSHADARALPIVVVRKPRVDKAKKAEAKRERKRATQAKVEAVVPKRKPKPKPRAKPTPEPKLDAEPEQADATKRTAERRGLPPSTVNRADDLRELAQTSPVSWSKAAKTADDHEVDPASRAAVDDHHHPFARGPPFVPPERPDGSMLFVEDGESGALRFRRIGEPSEQEVLAIAWAACKRTLATLRKSGRWTDAHVN